MTLCCPVGADKQPVQGLILSLVSVEKILETQCRMSPTPSSSGRHAAELCVRPKIPRLRKPQRRDNRLFKQHWLSQVTALVLYVTPEFNVLISNLITLQPIVVARGAPSQSNPVLAGLVQAGFCVLPGSQREAGLQVDCVVYL